MDQIQPLLKSLSIGEPQRFRNLTMFPLFHGKDRRPDYLTLDEALTSGKCRVTEVHQGGSVPELAFENLSGEKILLLDGEELVGAKQNRVLNLTILIAGMLKVVIPVSCVEQRRWSYRSAEFTSGGRAMYARGRAAKMAQVSDSLEANGTRHSDQGAVWEDIHGKAQRLNAMSDTLAAEALYRRASATTGQFKAALAWQGEQVGAVFAINGEIVGMDLFDASLTMAKAMPKLVESYALDAIDVPEAIEAAPGKGAAKAFLENVAAARQQTFAAVGEGEDVRLSTPDLTGGALVAQDRVVHLSAFHLGQSAGRQRQRFARNAA